MPPPNRDQETPVGFRFATAAALIRQEGYSHARAEKVLRAWERYARYAMMSGKTPASTAEHLARFERYQPLSARDPHPDDSELVDQQIAEDLRRHAHAIDVENPEHARNIHATADKIESTRTRDSARIAADVLHFRGPRHRAVATKPGKKSRRT